MDTDEPQLVTVELGNGTRTSGGRGPGQVQVPEDEARELVAQGLAVRCGAERALSRYVVTARGTITPDTAGGCSGPLRAGLVCLVRHPGRWQGDVVP